MQAALATALKAVQAVRDTYSSMVANVNISTDDLLAEFNGASLEQYAERLDFYKQQINAVNNNTSTQVRIRASCILPVCTALAASFEANHILDQFINLGTSPGSEKCLWMPYGTCYIQSLCNQACCSLYSSQCTAAGVYRADSGQCGAYEVHPRTSHLWICVSNAEPGSQSAGVVQQGDHWGVPASAGNCTSGVQEHRRVPASMAHNFTVSILCVMLYLLHCTSDLRNQHGWPFEPYLQVTRNRQILVSACMVWFPDTDQGHNLVHSNYQSWVD